MPIEEFGGCDTKYDVAAYVTGCSVKCVYRCNE